MLGQELRTINFPGGFTYRFIQITNIEHLSLIRACGKLWLHNGGSKQIQNLVLWSLLLGGVESNKYI